MPGDWGGGAGAGIAQTLEELGRIRAQQATQQGQIWGSTIANIGQNVGNAIEQAPVRAALEQERQQKAAEFQAQAQLRQQQAQDRLKQQQGDAALAAAISNPANLDPQTGQVDPLKVQQEVAGKGFADHGQKYVAAATATAKNAQELAGMKQAAAEKQQQLIVDAFNGVNPMDDTDLTARFGALAHQGVDAATLAARAQELDAAGPNGRAAVLKRWNDTSPDAIKAAKAAAAEAAKVHEIAPGGALGSAAKGVIVQNPKEAPEATLDQKTVLVDGIPTLVNYNTKTGKSYDSAGNDISARVQPLPKDTSTAEDERYEKIKVAQRLGQPVTPEESAWAQAYEKRKTLGPEASAAAAADRAGVVAQNQINAKGRDEYFTQVVKPYHQAQQSADSLRAIVNAAKAGNNIAGAFQNFQTTALDVHQNGFNRINTTELGVPAEAGSLWDRIEGRMGGLINGGSKKIPEDLQNDMLRFADLMEKQSQNRYRRDRQSILDTYTGVKLPDESGGGAIGGAGLSYQDYLANKGKK